MARKKQETRHGAYRDEDDLEAQKAFREGYSKR